MRSPSWCTSATAWPPILAFIGAKLTLHWAHLRWESVPEIPTLLSLVVIVGVLAVTTATSLVASRRADRLGPEREAVDA